MSTTAEKAGDMLDRVRKQAEHIGAQGTGLEKGYADLGWDLLEVAEMQYWRVNYDTFKEYLKLVAARARMTVPMLQRYMLTVRDLSDSFTHEQLQTIGITKAMKLRAVKDMAIVLPHAIVEAALDPKITVAELKKIASKELKLPEEEEVDWLDCEMEFPVTAEQRLTIEQAIKAAMQADPPTKLNISRPAQMLDVMLKFSMEFLGANPSE
jgi:hypothetical protein